jgi:hypothetical protein
LDTQQPRAINRWKVELKVKGGRLEVGRLEGGRLGRWKDLKVEGGRWKTTGGQFTCLQ